MYVVSWCVLPRVRFDGGAHGDDEAAHEQVGEEGGGQHEAQHDAVQAVQLHPAHNHPPQLYLVQHLHRHEGLLSASLG